MWFYFAKTKRMSNKHILVTKCWNLLNIRSRRTKSKPTTNSTINFFTNTLKFCIIHSANTIHNAKFQYKDNCTLLRYREWKVSRLAHYHIFAFMARLFMLLVSNMNFKTKCWYLFFDGLMQHYDFLSLMLT